jgi:hypothetical protein
LLPRWGRAFGPRDKELLQRTLRFSATQGIQASQECFLLGCAGWLSRGDILARLEQERQVYTRGLEAIRNADVPFPFLHPLDPDPFIEEENGRGWDKLIPFLSSLEEVPVTMAS